MCRKRSRTSTGWLEPTPIRSTTSPICASEHQTWRDGFALPVIAQVRGGGKTNDVDLNLHGKVLMDEVRHDLNDIIHKAEDNRTRRIALWHRQVHTMLLVLLFLALGMGVLIGLFTRNRLHAVSAAYRTSLEILGRRAEELFQSEQQLRTTLDSIGDGVITCDADGRIQMMNPVARELTGWSQAEARGQPLEKVFHIVNEMSRETVETPVAKVKRLEPHRRHGKPYRPHPQRRDRTEHRRQRRADSRPEGRDHRHRPRLSRHHHGAQDPGRADRERKTRRRGTAGGDDRA